MSEMQRELEKCFALTRVTVVVRCSGRVCDPLFYKSETMPGVRVVDYPAERVLFIGVDTSASGDAVRMLESHGFISDTGNGERTFVVSYDKVRALIEQINAFRRSQDDATQEDDDRYLEYEAQS